jgi:hypothetical protein
MSTNPSKSKFKFSLKRMFRYGDTIYPVRDWLLLLAAVVILLLLGFIWNAWLFFQIESGKVIGNATTTPGTAIPAETAVTDVQHVFQSRATEEGNYQNTYHFPDPSLQGVSLPVPSTVPASSSNATSTTSTTASSTATAR